MKRLYYWMQKRRWMYRLQLMVMEKLLTWRYDKDTWDFWVWEMTPLPIGMPFYSQYMDGLKLIFRKTPKQN